jgi:Protein of unknown function (DUF4089)
MEDDLPGRYLDDAAALLGLPIQKEHRAAALAAFTVLLAQGRLVTEFALPEDTDPAPRYLP